MKCIFALGLTLLTLGAFAARGAEIDSPRDMPFYPDEPEIVVPSVFACDAPEAMPFLIDTDYHALLQPLTPDSRYAWAVVYDQNERLHLFFHAVTDSPFDAPEQWRFDAQKMTYVPDSPSELKVYCFMTADPVFDVARGDCWLFHAARSAESTYSDDLYYLKRPSFDPASADRPDSAALFSIAELEPDTGVFSWRTHYLTVQTAPKMRRFYRCDPSGSAADVRCATRYENGVRRIEFVRPFVTGNGHDVPFDFAGPLYVQFCVVYPDGKTVYLPVQTLSTREELLEPDPAEFEFEILPDDPADREEEE